MIVSKMYRLVYGKYRQKNWKMEENGRKLSKLIFK